MAGRRRGAQRLRGPGRNAVAGHRAEDAGDHGVRGHAEALDDRYRGDVALVHFREHLGQAEVTETIGESVADFAARGYGIWLIELGSGAALAGSAPLVGTAGLRPLEESGLEIFYSLAPGAWGRGYATEAARAVVEYGLGPLGLPEVLAEVDEGNIASVAVVKRLGMTPYAVVPGVLGPMTRYRITAGTA